MQPTPYGEPKIVQRLELWWARQRPAPLRSLRCARGEHNPSPDTAFTCQGAVMVGGPCTRCDDQTAREVCWIGNEWDFPGVATQEETRGGGIAITVSPLAFLQQLEKLGLTYIGDYPA